MLEELWVGLWFFGIVKFSIWLRLRRKVSRFPVALETAMIIYYGASRECMALYLKEGKGGVLD